MATIDLATVNALADDAFVDVFGAVLEDSPHLAVVVVEQRPFADVDALAAAFAAVIDGLAEPEAVALLRAHPELGAKRPMAAASVEEQASAGLPDAEADLRSRLAAGNAAYRERFGFPFIIAVRGRTPDEIVAVLEERLGNDRPDELATALGQVATIARLRIDQIVEQP